MLSDGEVLSFDTILALGDFDGVHKGHQKLLSEACRLGETTDLAVGVYTFRQNTKLLLGDKRVSLLTTEEEKNELLAKTGIKFIGADDFNKVRDFSPAAFCSYLYERFSPKAVFCGENFTFGKKAAAGSADLAKLMAAYGCETHIVPGLTTPNGECISSTAVRRSVESGDMEGAAQLLGYPYFIRTRVVHGAMLGRKLGFPTVNQLEYCGKAVPKFGVYACLCKLDGRTFKGVVNVGVRPTVTDDKKVVFETHILDFDGDLYGKQITVSFYKMLRPERKFASLEELRENVFVNIRETREYFAKEEGSL